MAPDPPTWSLQEAPFLERLGHLLDEARQALRLDWMGVVDHRRPNGEAMWLACSPAQPQRPLKPEGDLRGPEAPYQTSIPLNVPPQVPGQPPVLLLAAVDPPDAAALRSLAACIAEGLVAWRRAEEAERALAAQDGEREAAERHQGFRTVLSALPDGVVVLQDQRIRFANPAFLRMVDQGEQDVLGATFATFVHREDRGVFDEADPHGVVQVRIQRPETPPRMAEISTAGSFWFEGEAGTILVSRDVTEHRMTQEMLHRAERLSALGSLAAGLAHEINNPLASMILNLQTLRDGAGKQLGEGDLELLRDSVDEAKRISRIITDLRAFSDSDQDAVVEMVDVAAAVATALNIAQNEIRHRATLHRHLESGARVLAREGPLVQVLVSLLVNAAQAIPDGASADSIIEVRCSTTEAEVSIVVRDSGVGIPEDVLPLVFDPFFSSKPRHEGSGLGLSIARRIVEDFGGRISLSSVVGQGTTVSLTLPRGEQGPASSGQQEPGLAGQALRVLIVDDEVAILRALTRVLEAHDVVPTAGNDEALAAIKAGPTFDVVLCDLMMPGLSGPAFLERAEALSPGIRERFLFMTGGAFTKTALDFLANWEHPVLKKPFDSDALLRALHVVANRNIIAP